MLTVISEKKVWVSIANLPDPSSLVPLPLSVPAEEVLASSSLSSNVTDFDMTLS